MKKTIALLLAVAMLATLTACGKKNDTPDGDNTTSSTEQVTTTTTDNFGGNLGENYNDGMFGEW